jgi:hypothetical protein
MRALVLIALLLAPLARAADDAPVAVVLVPAEQRVREGKAMAACQGELADLKRGNVTLSVPVAIAIVAGVLVAGAAAGAAVAVAAGPKR